MPKKHLPKQQESLMQEAHVTGPGSYNRESGRKTLVFVGILITMITILTVLSLLLLTK